MMSQFGNLLSSWLISKSVAAVYWPFTNVTIASKSSLETSFFSPVTTSTTWALYVWPWVWNPKLSAPQLRLVTHSCEMGYEFMIPNHISKQREVQGLKRACQIIVHHVQFSLAYFNYNYEIWDKYISTLAKLDQRLHNFQHGQNARES